MLKLGQLDDFLSVSDLSRVQLQKWHFTTLSGFFCTANILYIKSPKKTISIRLLCQHLAS